MYKLNEQKMFYDMAEGQAIVINFTTGMYYGTSSLGSAVLDALVAGAEPAQILTAVQALPGRIIDPDEGSAETLDQADADEQLTALIDIMTALEEHRIIGQIALIDMTDVTNIRMEYPHLLTVRLGGGERLNYKISYLAAAVEELEDNQNGELDVSFEFTESAVFTPAR